MRRDARHHVLAPSEPDAEALPREEFKAEVRAWAAKLEVEPAAIHITDMRRKWASCSTRGRVTFATDLLAQPKAFRREVIVHELLHIKIPNHGPLFRALLSTYLSGGDTRASEPDPSGDDLRMTLPQRSTTPS
jgi:predicted metal-dependent hydrolase